MQDMRLLSTILLPLCVVALVACGGGQEEASQADAEAAPDAEIVFERYRAVVVPEGLTWEEAKERAEADGGHLATIASAEENSLVHELIAENSDIWVNVDLTVVSDGEENPVQISVGPWIGLYQPPDSPEPNGGWTWVTGEATDYSNWSKQPESDESEPNDMGGVEHYGHFFGIGLDNPADAWNDMPNDPISAFAEAGMPIEGDVQNPRGYIVEFEQ